MNLISLLEGATFYAIVIDTPSESEKLVSQTFPVFMTAFFVLIGLGVLLLIGLAMRKK
mgnify:CR=1 FL=1